MRAFFMDLMIARKKYQAHQARAKSRGIGFDLTFDQWLSEWGDKLDLIGIGVCNYGMCRIMDRGPYAVGNVYIGTPKRNAHTRRLVNMETTYARLQKEYKTRERFISPPEDGESWEDENPWVPTEMRLKTSWGWGHR